jgi:hypothetical protein
VPAIRRNAGHPHDSAHDGRHDRRHEHHKGQAVAALADLTMLKVPASVTDTTKAAAFLTSGHARMMTGTVLNSSGGAVAD